jgi:hypothetical protein
LKQPSHLFDPLSAKNSKRIAAADEKLNQLSHSPSKKKEAETEYMSNFLADFLIKTEEQI